MVHQTPFGELDAEAKMISRRSLRIDIACQVLSVIFASAVVFTQTISEDRTIRGRLNTEKYAE